MLKKILIASLLSLSPFQNALAEVQTITVHGQQVAAKNIDYFVGTNTIHSFEVSEPVTFSFANGNTFTAYDKVFLAKSGTISMILSPRPQLLEWVANDGRRLHLDCSPVFNPTFGANSIKAVSFHENKSYFRGCRTASGTDESGQPFPDAAGGKIFAKGDIELDPDSNLIFAQFVVSGEVQIGSKAVKLRAGTGISYHSPEQINFFTPAEGETFEVELPKYGTVTFSQKKGKPTSTKFFEDGKIELGVLAEKIKHAELGFSIPAGSGVVFSERADGAKLLTGIVYPEPVKYQVEGYLLTVSKFLWDSEKGYYNVFITEPFTFTIPDSQQILPVPPGSLVGLSKDWVIIGIKVPNSAGQI